MSEVDLSFCDSCESRGQVIDGYYCAMSGIDIMGYLLRGRANEKVLTIDESGAHDSTTAEVSMSLGSELFLDVVDCIKQVQAGGEPLPVQDA